MRRLLLVVGFVAAFNWIGTGSWIGAGVAAAGGQEEPPPGEDDPSAPDTTRPPTTVPVGPGPTTVPPTTLPGATTLPTLPPDCDVPPPAAVVFVGRLTAAAGGVARFEVEAVRRDPDGRVAIGRPVDVTLGTDLRYLTYDAEYLVGAQDDGAGGLRSKVHEPEPLLGGDQVVGLNDADPDCPPLSDPIVVRSADGGSVDTGVFSGFLDDKRGIGMAFLMPFAAVVGVLVGLVVVKYVLIGAWRGARRLGRHLRRRGVRAGRRAPLPMTGR